MPFIADNITVATKAPEPDNTEWHLCDNDEGEPWECEDCQNTGWWIFRNYKTGAERIVECGSCENPHGLPKP